MSSYCSKPFRYSKGSEREVKREITGDFFVGELVFELVGVQVEFAYHLVYAFHVIF